MTRPRARRWLSSSLAPSSTDYIDGAANAVHIERIRKGKAMRFNVIKSYRNSAAGTIVETRESEERAKVVAQRMTMAESDPNMRYSVEPEADRPRSKLLKPVLGS